MRKAFEWKAYKQLSNVEIARKLNKMGVKLSDKRLNDLFLNPFYCGLIVSKMLPGQVIEGKHEPLISRELFLMVHNIRQEKRVHGFVYDSDNENLPLKVFAKCDKCGTPLTGYLVRKKGLYYYKCNKKGCKVNRSAKAMHEMFGKVLTMFKIGKGEFELVRLQLEEQMAVFFKSQLEEAKLLKNKLAETKRKLEAIEERFVIGEIDRNLYQKFRPKYEKECFEIEQELGRTGGYKSNLIKVVDFAAKLCLNPLEMWGKSDLDGKRVFQNLLFPEGIIYNRESDSYRTSRVNSFFSPIPQLTRGLGKQKSGNSIKIDKISALVTPERLEPPTF
ncbi:MAG: recombinase family protein [Draconibacterium sp.]